MEPSRDDTRPNPEPGDGDHETCFLGESGGAALVRKHIRRAGKVQAPVLITGESGTGKDLVARLIHQAGEPDAGPFVVRNCSAIPETLIEAELFGHEAGAFTDARTTHRGAFEIADGGTLFLDEVGDLSLTAQPKFLRAIESGEIQRIGGEKTIKTHARIVAATNRDLKTMALDGRFRSDLYYRISVIRIDVPPLRDRLGDLDLLVGHFSKQVAEDADRPYRGISSSAVRKLRHYHWPGNVRELKSVIERAMAMNSGAVLDENCMVMDFDADAVAMGVRRLLQGDWRTSRQEFQRLYAETLLRKHRGNVKEAAREAGVAVASFYRMLRRHDLQPGSGESS